MKRIVIAIAIVVIANSAFAGLTYKVESASTGIHEGTTTGVAEVEGKSFRFNVSVGDGAILNDSSFIVSQNGRTVAVVDPSSKSYYEIALDQLSGGVTSMMQQFGGLLTFTISNPKVSVRDLGNSDKIEGYATKHTSVDISYDLNLNAMGQKTTIAMSTSTENWATDQIPSELASFLQTGALHTGVPEVDKLLEAHANALRGFPLKQITTLRMTQNGSPMESKTTTIVSGIAKKNFAASEFVIPAGFAKTDNPLEKMMKSMGGEAKQ